MINKRKRNILITIIVLLSIASDQISKVWVRNNFESYIEKSIIGDVFTLIKVENTGAFLGMGSELSETLRVLLLIVLPVIVLVSISIYTYIDKSLDKNSIIGFSLIIGGGIGNIFDRIVYGSVTDFLYLNFGGIMKTGIFNIADLSVTTGMILILISSFKKGDKIIHIHCASHGEYLLSKKLIENLKQRFENHKFLLSFISPSGYENVENDLFDCIIYLPLASNKNCVKFYNIIKPTATFFIKNEVWPNYIKHAKLNGLKIYL